MKVTLFAVGFVDNADGCEIEKKVNNLVLDIPRIPCKGERMGLWIDDVWIDAKVKDVWTNFREKGNPHIKESAWGVDFSITLYECEIMEQYK